MVPHVPALHTQFTSCAGRCVFGRTLLGYGRVRSFALATYYLWRKDLRIEVRTREIVTTAGFFAILVAIMASLAFFTERETAPGAIWIPVAFASILAISRSFQREREDSALTGVLVSPVPRAAIFAGKALGIFTFLMLIECVLVPVVMLIFHVDALRVIGPLSLLLLLGTLGVAALGTLFGAMTVRTKARDLVLSSVLLPLLTPALLTGVVATAHVFAGTSDWSELRDYVLLLGIFDAIALGAGFTLFGALIEE
jgi:heme exporter protein B